MENNFDNYKYIYPPNAREQKQLDIMIEKEKNNLDPLDINIIEQDVLFKTEHWYVSQNRFPYEGVEYQFLIVSMDKIYTIHDMSKEMWDDLRKVWEKIINDYNIDGGALCFRFGNCSKSGASLKRLHAHIIMPKEEVKTKFTIGGRKKLKECLKIGDNND